MKRMAVRKQKRLQGVYRAENLHSVGVKYSKLEICLPILDTWEDIMTVYMDQVTGAIP